MAALLDHYEIQYRHIAGWQTTRCPAHDEQDPSFRVHLDEGGFQCMACGVRGGDVYALVMAVEGCSFPESKKLIAEWIGLREGPSRRAPAGRSSPGRRGYKPAYRRKKSD